MSLRPDLLLIMSQWIDDVIVVLVGNKADLADKM